MSTILDRITAAQNSHDADLFASYFADDYESVQPAHPDRAFSGRAQVLENWISVFAGVPDFRAELTAFSGDGNREWGEFDWRGHHTDGSSFAMRGVVILTVRDDMIATGRLSWSPSSKAAQTSTPRSRLSTDHLTTHIQPGSRESRGIRTPHRDLR